LKLLIGLVLPYDFIRPLGQFLFELFANGAAHHDLSERAAHQVAVGRAAVHGE
jgi:hypothetical protein